MAYLYIVQHPLVEPGYGRVKPGTRLHIPWNRTNTHRRKFIKRNGSYLDVSNRLLNHELYFWGEYEPPTECVVENGKHIKAVHDILYPVRGVAPVPPDAMNTDPYVFGDYFKNICCGISRRIYMPDDVIIFGKIDKKGISFLLDTVFVVKERVNINPFLNKTQYYKASIEPIPSRKKTYFYRGENYFSGKRYYSFVPCLLTYKDIPRPQLNMSMLGFSVVHGGRSLWSAPRIVFRNRHWNIIQNAVRGAGWHIGVHIDKI